VLHTNPSSLDMKKVIKSTIDQDETGKFARYNETQTPTPPKSTCSNEKRKQWYLAAPRPVTSMPSVSRYQSTSIYRDK
jgi:hypothetical protein